MTALPEGIVPVILTTIVVVGACVTLHYEGLRALSGLLPIATRHRRKRMIVVMLCMLAIHTIEIWFFGFGYFYLLQNYSVGELQGMGPVNMFDCVYYSAMAYTTIGFGDIVPSGAIRLLTGMEGLTGLVMITWSASFTFIAMQSTWKNND